MAIEDAAALGVVLPSGTSADQVPERLRLYEQCRHERATAVQQFSRIAGGDNKDKDFDSMLSLQPKNFAITDEITDFTCALSDVVHELQLRSR
jgi:2-polyprenyl-6-methoxyphenol hydroxylase-like FAD-dependent oxidoreductase